MQVARITADCEPGALVAEGQRVDSCILIASTHLLNKLTIPGIEYPDLNALL